VKPDRQDWMLWQGDITVTVLDVSAGELSSNEESLFPYSIKGDPHNQRERQNGMIK